MVHMGSETSRRACALTIGSSRAAKAFTRKATQIARLRWREGQRVRVEGVRVGGVFAACGLG